MFVLEDYGKLGSVQSVCFIHFLVWTFLFSTFGIGFDVSMYLSQKVMKPFEYTHKITSDVTSYENINSQTDISLLSQKPVIGVN